MSETIIPASNRTSKKHAGENQKYVGSRQGEKFEAPMTKNASIKHHNPEYFKRQSDRKTKDSIPERKDVPIQRDFNKHQSNVGKDPGRGVGKVGKDQAPFQMKQFSKGTMY